MRLKLHFFPLWLTSFLFRINTNCSCFLLNCCPLIYIIIPFHSLINEVCLQIVAHSQVFTIILALNLCLKCGIFLRIGFEFETTYVMHAYVIFSWQAFNNMCVTDSKRFPIYIDRRQQPKKPSPPAIFHNTKISLLLLHYY